VKPVRFVYGVIGFRSAEPTLGIAAIKQTISIAKCSGKEIPINFTADFEILASVVFNAIKNILNRI